MFFDRCADFIDTFAAKCRYQQNRRQPCGALGAHFQHGFQLRLNLRRAVSVGFVHHKNIGDFQNPRLESLNRITRLGRQQNNRRVSDFHNVELRLPDSDRLDQNSIHAERIKKFGHFACRAGNAAPITATSQTADKNAVIGRMILHPNAITQNSSAGKRTRRINGNDADFFIPTSVSGRESIHEGGFARSRRAGDADLHRPPTAFLHAGHDCHELGRAGFDLRNQAGKRQTVP